MAVCALATVQCAAPPQTGSAFSFAVMGDVPYTEAEEKRFLGMMKRIDAEKLAFVIHVGDIKGSGPCSDEFFARRKSQFDASAHPFFFTPGDNEWRDCRDPRNGAMDPLDRLARIRQVFFADRSTLGRRRMQAAAQDQCVEPNLPGCACAPYPENRAWSIGRVNFVTLNVPGIHVEEKDPRMLAESRCREEANRQWLERAVRESEGEATRALVVFIQANPWDVQRHLFRGFVDQLGAAAARLAKPVLLVHGDTHTYQVDAPLADIVGAPPGIRLTRLETYGSPFVGWVKVTIDPALADPFRFEPRLEAFVLPGL